MLLAELLPLIPNARGASSELAQRTVRGVEFDSRRVGPGFLFFAHKGANSDGNAYAGQAIERGALAIVSEMAAPPEFPGAWIQVDHTREAMALWSRAFYGYLDQKLNLTGVTGTNGKTSIVFMVDALNRHAGRTTGLVGTIEYRVGAERRPAVNTTPDSIDLDRLFAEMIAAGATHAAMEVSSHALALKRVYGRDFHTVVFTNLTQDHLDFHLTMENYFAAKQLLFLGAGGAPPRWAIINQDDEWGRKLRMPSATRVLTYGTEAGAELRASNIQAAFDGLRFDVVYQGARYRVQSPLAARFNVHNLLAAFGAGLSLGLEPDTVTQGLATLDQVPGRFERIDEGQNFLVVVDYAHTDDALKNTIKSLRELKPKRVITLFGCGGDRDRRKRPLMGQVAGSLSDFVVLTSDNPRTEDPLQILNDALVGVRRTDTRHVVEPDREKAIARAIAEAGPGDAVLLAGKGHETYQVLNGRTIHFDDREVAREVLRGYGSGKGTRDAN